jgi:hypothetical protein
VTLIPAATSPPRAPPTGDELRSDAASSGEMT